MRYILLILLFLSVAAFAEEKPVEGLGNHLKQTAVDAFDTTGLNILAVGVLGTVIAFNQDQSVHDTWVGHQRMSADVSNFGNFWGMGIAQVAIAGAQIYFDRENGIANAEGLIESTAVVYALKFSTQRPRPDSDTRTSFPSGHTQISFSSATSLAMSYGWKAAIPAYALGIFTGLSRMADDAHWLSDVVAGAAVGILFGRAGYKHHFAVQPMAIDDGGHGFGLVARFNF